jgi:1A family penicillin-binding protein
MYPRSRLKPSDYANKGRGIKRILFLHKHKRKLIYAGLAVLIVLIIIPPATYLYFAKDLKNKESVMNRQETGLVLLDRDGNKFYALDQAKSISYVPISEIPIAAQDAIIASEDKNFYTNAGFSIRGMLRAFVVNIFAGRVVEGGSTITQQLAKNAFLSSSRNVIRKYQELVLATELNRRFSKEDVLEMYLNSVYFGEGAFGIENAAQAYFGISTKELDLAQSALLIGLLPAPSVYSPLSNPPDKALTRQKVVLQEMVESGMITQDQADQAANEKLQYNPQVRTENTLAPHFAYYVRDQLIKEYGEERVIRDGFTVTTTLNRNLQEYAESSVKTQVTRLTYNEVSNAAVVALDPKNGQILTMVGSYDWNDPDFGQTNMAVTSRQPGSSFKPIIYARAIEDKLITPATILHDVKTTFSGGYEPHDYDRRYRGDVTVRRALATSLNIPAVEVMEKVGVEHGIDQAKKLGIDTLDANHNYGLSLVLGTGEVPLLEMTNAYATFADEGLYHKTTGIISITDKYGKNVPIQTTTFIWFNPLTWFAGNYSNGKQVVSKETAFLISSILSDNAARSEIFGGALSIGRPAAVKTGTTEDYRDALTIGYTPSLVVGVWVGNNDNMPMDNIAGSLGAAPIWRNVMESYLMGTPIEQFTKPNFVISQTVCPYGGIAGYTEYFIAGTQPEPCDIPAKPSPTRQPTATVMPTNVPTDEPTVTPTPQITQITNTPTPTQAKVDQLLPTTTIQLPVDLN